MHQHYLHKAQFAIHFGTICYIKLLYIYSILNSTPIFFSNQKYGVHSPWFKYYTSSNIFKLFYLLVLCASHSLLCVIASSTSLNCRISGFKCSLIYSIYWYYAPAQQPILTSIIPGTVWTTTYPQHHSQNIAPRQGLYASSTEAYSEDNQPDYQDNHHRRPAYHHSITIRAPAIMAWSKITKSWNRITTNTGQTNNGCSCHYVL